MPIRNRACRSGTAGKRRLLARYDISAESFRLVQSPLYGEGSEQGGGFLRAQAGTAPLASIVCRKILPFEK